MSDTKSVDWYEGFAAGALAEREGTAFVSGSIGAGPSLMSQVLTRLAKLETDMEKVYDRGVRILDTLDDLQTDQKDFLNRVERLEVEKAEAT